MSLSKESKEADRGANWSYEGIITLINIWTDINICLKNTSNRNWECTKTLKGTRSNYSSNARVDRLDL